MIRVSNCFRLRTCTPGDHQASKKLWATHQENPSTINPWRSTSTWHNLVSSSSTIYHHLPSSTIIYHHLPSSTIIYHHLPSSTIIYHHLPSSTIIYHHLPSSTIIYHHLPSSTIIYHHLPSSTIIYHHLPSSTIIYHSPWPFTMSSPWPFTMSSSPCHHVICWGFPTEEGEAEHGQRRSDLRGSSRGSLRSDRRTPCGACGVGAGCLVRAEEWPGAEKAWNAWEESGGSIRSRW